MFIAETSYFPLMYPIVLSLKCTLGCQNFYIFLLAGFYEERNFKQQLQSYFRSGSSTKWIFSKGDGVSELYFHYSILSDNTVLILDRSSVRKTSLKDINHTFSILLYLLLCQAKDHTYPSNCCLGTSEQHSFYFH